jgi:hypothetical protein
MVAARLVARLARTKDNDGGDGQHITELLLPALRAAITACGDAAFTPLVETLRSHIADSQRWNRGRGNLIDAWIVEVMFQVLHGASLAEL